MTREEIKEELIRIGWSDRKRQKPVDFDQAIWIAETYGMEKATAQDFYLYGYRKQVNYTVVKDLWTVRTLIADSFALEGKENATRRQRLMEAIDGKKRNKEKCGITQLYALLKEVVPHLSNEPKAHWTRVAQIAFKHN
jgi:hypothetical protein